MNQTIPAHQSPKMTKDLVINGHSYAKYEIDDDRLFLHVMNLKPGITVKEESAHEEFLAEIIRMHEGVVINFLAYLKI